MTREAVATETAVVDAAVAAAAAAAEAAAASKAAAAHEAAAAANEQRALDVHTPSEKSDMPKEPGGGVGLKVGEDFSGGELECGGHSTTMPLKGAVVVAAPRHGLRRGHLDGLRPWTLARASTHPVPRPCIRGRACIYRDLCLVF